MQQAISHARLVNITRLGVGDFEVVVPTVYVCPILKFPVKSQNIAHQVYLKLLRVYLALLPAQKFFPGLK